MSEAVHGGSKFAFSHWQDSSLIQQLVAATQAVMYIKQLTQSIKMTIRIAV